MNQNLKTLLDICTVRSYVGVFTIGRFTLFRITGSKEGKTLITGWCLQRWKDKKVKLVYFKLKPSGGGEATGTITNGTNNPKNQGTH